MRNPGLTRREREVVRQVAKGLREKEIADVLSISLRTVSTHTEHVREKLRNMLGTRNVRKAEVIKWAIANGLTQLPSVPKTTEGAFRREAGPQ